MKKAARILTAFLMAILLLGIAPQAYADTPEDSTGDAAVEPYTYQVTVYAGRHGHFAGGSKSWTGQFAAGESVDLDLESLGFEMDNDEYYPKGIRKAGHDNSTAFVQLREPVNEDMDFEVAYGVKGGMVSYKVTYVDENGNELLPSDTYYGMVGDKPVVSYKYIEGYQPTAYKEKKTLGENEADNVFPFIYRAVASGAENAAGAGTAGAAGTTNAAGTTGNGGAAGAGGNAGAAGVDNAGAQAGDQNQEPAEIVDLDEEDVPLADDPDADGSKEDADTEEVEDGGLPLSGPAIGGIAAGAVAILALIAWLLARKKSQDEAE